MVDVVACSLRLNLLRNSTASLVYNCCVLGFTRLRRSTPSARSVPAMIGWRRCRDSIARFFSAAVRGVGSGECLKAALARAVLELESGCQWPLGVVVFLGQSEGRDGCHESCVSSERVLEEAVDLWLTLTAPAVRRGDSSEGLGCRPAERHRVTSRESGFPVPPRLAVVAWREDLARKYLVR